MLFELESVNNFSGCHWIWMKFGEVYVASVCRFSPVKMN